MKIKPEHYLELCSMLDFVVDTCPGADPVAKHRKFIIAEGKAQDVEMRLRWDLLWTAPKERRQPWFDAVYAYANDTHVDTALRRYMKERNYAPVQSN